MILVVILFVILSGINEYLVSPRLGIPANTKMFANRILFFVAGVVVALIY